MQKLKAVNNISVTLIDTSLHVPGLIPIGLAQSSPLLTRWMCQGQEEGKNIGTGCSTLHSKPLEAAEEKVPQARGAPKTYLTSETTLTSRTVQEQKCLKRAQPPFLNCTSSEARTGSGLNYAISMLNKFIIQSFPSNLPAVISAATHMHALSICSLIAGISLCCIMPWPCHSPLVQVTVSFHFTVYGPQFKGTWGGIHQVIMAHFNSMEICVCVYTANSSVCAAHVDVPQLSLNQPPEHLLNEFHSLHRAPCYLGHVIDWWQQWPFDMRRTVFR